MQPSLVAASYTFITASTLCSLLRPQTRGAISLENSNEQRKS